MISSRNEVVGILFQHLFIDLRRLRRVALQLGDPRLVVEGAILVEAAQRSCRRPQLRERGLRLVSLPLSLLGVPEALVRQEPQTRVELAPSSFS